MFSKDSRFNLVLSLLFVLLSACGGVGTGCGCSPQPLPEGGLPKDQTVEGGGQFRRSDFETRIAIPTWVIKRF